MEEMNFEDLLVHSDELDQFSEAGLEFLEDIYGEEFVHSGQKGMKWGVRRYQNEDGSLTPLGRIHYGYKKRKTRKKRKAALKKANEAKKAKKLQEEAAIKA